MNIFFDARVIQDHFPGIGRYAWNLLAALPKHLAPGDTLTLLHDPGAKNTRFDMAALAHPAVRRVETSAPIFGLSNALRNPAPREAIAHFPYYVRPYLRRGPSVTTLYDAISFLYPQLIPSAMTRLMIRLLTELAVRTGDAFNFFNADEQPPLFFAVGFVIAGNESPVTQEVLG